MFSRVLPSPSRSSCFKHIRTSGFKHIRGPLTLQSRALSCQRYQTGPIDSDPADDWNAFDVLIPDLDYPKLNGEVSKQLGHQYLSRVPNVPETLKPKREVHGIMYGRNCRILYTLITTYEHRSYYVHWLYDCGSPFTYLSYEACDVIFGNNPVPQRFNINLNGHTVATTPAPAKSHFKDINILGTDFILLNKVRAIQDGNLIKTSLVFHKVHQETEKGRGDESR